MIYISRSSDDEYTPPTDVDLIQSLLINCLKEIYEDKIEVFMTYKDD